MKKYVTISWTVILICFFLGPVFGQTSHTDHDRHSTTWNKDCLNLEDFDLSVDQLAAVNKIEEQYKNRIIESYQSCMLKKIELRTLLRSRDSDEDTILKKSNELSVMRNQLYNQMIEYQIRIRKILTPDQRSNWCTMMKSPGLHGGW